MKNFLAFVCVCFLFHANCIARQNDMYHAAKQLLSLLDKNQQKQIQYSFDTDERYTWHFVPKDDRKGLPINSMNTAQRKAAMQLMKTGLSKEGYEKASAIMALEKILKLMENRGEQDHYRDTGKYFFTFFGEPSVKSAWGWRVDGHHLSLSFSSEQNRLVSGTPGFFGSNPAIVLSGPEKGLEILKDETQLGLALVHACSAQQSQKAIISNDAPGDILTYNNRKAMIEKQAGLSYGEMSAAQQKIFLRLLSIYIQRYTHLFAAQMMQDITAAGMDHLLFAWAGSTEDGTGHPKYYRIQGPTIIIEYDNTQNNGNHIHSVVRDLKNDFGGDALLEHYKKDHTTK